MGTKEICKVLKRIQVLEDGRVPAKEAKNRRIEGQKKRLTRNEYQRLVNMFEMEGFMAHKGLWKSCLMKKVMLSENIKLCMKKTSGAIG